MTNNYEYSQPCPRLALPFSRIYDLSFGYFDANSTKFVSLVSKDGLRWNAEFEIMKFVAVNILRYSYDTNIFPEWLKKTSHNITCFEHMNAQNAFSGVLLQFHYLRFVAA
jgi:hypothetical protein